MAAASLALRSPSATSSTLDLPFHSGKTEASPGTPVAAASLALGSPSAISSMLDLPFHSGKPEASPGEWSTDSVLAYDDKLARCLFPSANQPPQDTVNGENSDPNQLTVKRSLSFQKFPAGTRQKLVHCAKGRSAVPRPPLKSLEDERPAETAMADVMDPTIVDSV